MVKRYDQGDHWTNLRNLAYLDEFDQPKIIYPNMRNSLPFAYDVQNHWLTNQKCYIITGPHLPYLASILNSSTFRFCFKDNFPELLGNTYELSKVFFEKIPIKRPDPATEWIFNRLADYILRGKTDEAAPTAALFFQQLVNGVVYELYFADALSKAGIQFMCSLTEKNLPVLAEGEAGLATLKSVYATFHDQRHPLRIGLSRLDTVREVRIIEGKDK